MNFLLALVLSTLSGFIALSYEILWIRVFSFMAEGVSPAFGVLLAAYLGGLAWGSLLARRFCRNVVPGRRREQLRVLAWFLLAANVLAFLLIPTLAFLVPAGLLVRLTLPLFALVAALLGTGFPLISHFGIPPGSRVGSRLSYLYVANIVGSGAGSLLTGFVLLDHLTLRGVSVFLVLAGVLMSVGTLFLSRTRLPGMLATGVVAGVVAVLAAPSLFDRTWERLQQKHESDQAFATVIENRSGVITVTQAGHVYGGGGYDGKFNTSLTNDTNVIRRVYALAALHDNPERVLVVGLGSGSWTQVAVHHPRTKELVAVEINRGYIQLMETSPVVRSLLDNRKVSLVVDDGRRWLQRHDETFDLIIQNTTQHWRSHATNIVSREYFEILRRHLEPGGVVVVNATGSADVERTFATVFPYTWQFHSCVYGSDRAIRPDKGLWERVLRAYRIDGKRVIDPDVPADEKALHELLHDSWENRESILRRTAKAGIVTDDNMLCEWR